MYSQPTAPNAEDRDTNGAATIMPPGDRPAVWYVAYARPKQENMAAVNLQQQGFHTYLPMYKTFRTKPKQLVSTTDQIAGLITYEPMFPRYIFFQPSSYKQSISAARSTRGINSIVRFGPTLAVVQPEMLKAIREFEQRRNQTDLQYMSLFQPGRRVRLRDPNLNRLEGLVHSVSAQRVIVLMEILGRQKLVKVEHNRVELA